MADEPQDEQGGPDQPQDEPGSPAQPRDDATAELPAVPAVEPPAQPEASDEPPAQPEPSDEAPAQPEPIDEAMLAAFLGDQPETSVSPDASTSSVTPDEISAPDEETVVVAAVTETTPEPVSPDARRRSAWSTMLIVVGLVLIGGALVAGGLYVGRVTAPAPSVVVQPEEVVEEDVAAEMMPVGPMPVPAPGTLIVTTARVPSATWPVLLTAAAGLTDDAGTAPGYRLVNSGISGGQVASVLAGAFGVPGSVVTSSSGWEVGTEGAPRIVVRADPLFAWTYENPAALALAPLAAPLEAADALALATETLAGIGVDISTVEYQVGVEAGRTVISAWQLVGEQRTQLGWRLVFDGDGSVLAASGFSSGFEAVPDYAVVGAATAVARSQQSPWTSIPASPITGPTDGSAADPVPSPTSIGAPVVALPLSTVEVISAELGLAQYWQPDGSILLLPSYILTSADGSTWSLLAVAEPSVTFVDQPFPLTGEQYGFVAGPFPNSDPGQTSAPVDELGSATPAPATDDGMVDENGEPVFSPPADPAASP